MTEKTITLQQVIELVMRLPPDRLISVYDFVSFIQSHPLTADSRADFFGETPEELQEDEEKWEKQFSETRENLLLMAHEAAAEYQAGKAKPFTPPFVD
jgi:hypothetical protein